jgi:hypothetical protein
VDPPASLTPQPEGPPDERRGGSGLVLGSSSGSAGNANASFHTEKQLSGFLDAPFVVGFPVLPTRAETQRRKWVLTLKLASGCVMVSIMTLAEFYVYRRG